jgi:hypothetical protein
MWLKTVPDQFRTGGDEYAFFRDADLRNVPVELAPRMSVLKHNFHVAKSLHERRMLAKQVGQNWDKGYGYLMLRRYKH